MDTAVSITASWRDVGVLGLDHASMLLFPRAPETAGLYRFELRYDDSVYIGETDNLRRRLQHYRTPGPGQRTNIRMNGLLSGALAQKAGVTVSICDEARILIDGSWRSADLNRKFERVLIENAMLVCFTQRGITILNAEA